MIPLVAQFSRNRNTEYLPSAAHDERDRPTDAGGHFRIATLLSRQVVLTHYLSGAEAWDVCKGTPTRLIQTGKEMTGSGSKLMQRRSRHLRLHTRPPGSSLTQDVVDEILYKALT